MKTEIKLMVVAAMLALGACGGGSGTGGAGGGSAAGGGGGGGAGGGGGTPTCFSGTPTTNDQLLNSCVDQTVEKILKPTSWRDPGVTLPALP